MSTTDQKNPHPLLDKMRADWDRRARVDARYWVAATEEADLESYEASAERDADALLTGLADLVPKTARVLDLGCGIGRLSALLVSRFAEVVGVDVSPEMIKTAAALHQAPNLSFAVNSGADLAAFPDGHFGLVFAYSVLPHLPLPVVQAYFAEVNRVLAPGGVFRYQFWVGPEAVVADESDSLSIRVLDEASFAALNQEAGFELLAREPIDYTDPVLKLQPVWVNARKVAEARLTPAPLSDAPEMGEDERGLESGLLLYLAAKHAERGEPDEAERVLEAALLVSPERVEVYLQLADLHLSRDDERGAVRWLTRLTEVVPEAPEGWLFLAQAALAQDDPKGARAALERFDALKPDDPELRAQADQVRRLLIRKSYGTRRVKPRPKHNR